MITPRSVLLASLCVLYFVPKCDALTTYPSRYTDSQNVKYNPRYEALTQPAAQQAHVAYQQAFETANIQRKPAPVSATKKQTKTKAPAKVKLVSKKPVSAQKTNKNVKPVAQTPKPLRDYQYAALQAAKVAYAKPVGPVYAAPVVYATPKPATNTVYKFKNANEQAAYNAYQKQIQQWQIAVLNGYQPQYDPNAQPAYPGNVYIQSAYYPGYSPPYPQPAQPYPQQPYPQTQPYPPGYPQPAPGPVPAQPEPVEQPANPDQFPDTGVVEAATNPPPSENGAGVIPSEVSPSEYPQQPEAPQEQGPAEPIIAPEQPAPAQPSEPEVPSEQPQPYPQQPQPYPEQPQPYPQQPQPYPEQPQPYPEQPQPYPEQPQPAPEQPQPYPEQPIPAEVPAEAQPAYPPIGPDPTLPEGETSGPETYPGQPPLLPAATEFPSTTESFTESTTSAASSGLLQYCASPRGQYPSPNSCNSYINCWDDVAIEQECPSGLYFGETTCDYPDNVDCGDRPVPAPTTEVAGGEEANNGTAQCPSNFGTFKSKKNCGAFIVCVAGEAYDFSCPGGTNYNDRLKVCDYPYRVDCGDLPPNPNPIQPEEGSEESSSTEIDQPTSVTPEYPAQPAQPAPEQPVYPAPEQPVYPAPEQPAYPAPEQPAYPAPEQPAYPAPEQPAYPVEQPAQPAEYPSGTPVTETTVVAELPPNYFYNQYYGYNNRFNPYQIRRVPIVPAVPPKIKSRGFVNTGVRCNRKTVLKLTRSSCESVSICRGGFTHLVQCSAGTAYDSYKQKCIASYKARC